MIDPNVRQRLHELGGVELPTDREVFIQNVKDTGIAVRNFFFICIIIVQCTVMSLFGKSCK